VDISGSARRHHVSDVDIVHAYEHAVTWVELGDDPPRYLVVGPDRSGNLLELVVIEVRATALVIHGWRCGGAPSGSYSEERADEQLWVHRAR
jgi:hypothetical protein